jgi:hypothetical protein
MSIILNLFMKKPFMRFLFTTKSIPQPQIFFALLFLYKTNIKEGDT